MEKLILVRLRDSGQAFFYNAGELSVKEGDIIEIFGAVEIKDELHGLPGDEVSDGQLKLLSGPKHFSRTSGKVIGKHNGAHFFTIGQRKGINIRCSIAVL